MTPYTKPVRITVFLVLLLLLAISSNRARAWGFFAHEKINRKAVYLLPKPMMAFYKVHEDYLGVHAVDPDKRRKAITNEGPRHYIDLDHYPAQVRTQLPNAWEAALAVYGLDSLYAYGVGPWWVVRTYKALTQAMMDRDARRVLKLSADLGHYVADLHVPLHSTLNYDGQLTGQKGLHALWESRLPELYYEKWASFPKRKAQLLEKPDAFIWEVVQQSFAAKDSVLQMDKLLMKNGERAFDITERKGQPRKEIAESYAAAYYQSLNGQVERRFLASIEAVASFWYSAWVEAGQPPLENLVGLSLTPEEQDIIDKEHQAWLLRICESDTCLTKLPKDKK